MINWDKISLDDEVHIDNIVSRFMNEVGPWDRMSLSMDLAAVHINTPLKLEELVHADSFNFIHDVGDIINNINRDSGMLINCFSPRFTA